MNEPISIAFGWPDIQEADLLRIIRKARISYLKPGPVSEKNKEENAMRVVYKGTTGLLQKLERQEMVAGCGYILEIWDCSRECKISFSGVSLKDVKFLGGEVTYG